MIRTTVLELLEGNPAASIQDAVGEHVDTVRAEFGLGPMTRRVTKVGPKLYVEVEGVVDGATTVTDEHRIRERLLAELDHFPYEIWLNVEFVPTE